MIRKCIALAMLFSFTAMASATEIVFEKKDFKGHLQGIAADKTGIYWSFYDVIHKTDYTGKITASIASPVHAGDLCFFEGKIYVAVSYHKKSDIQRDGGKGWVYVYDQNLKFLEKISMPDTPNPDGITRYGDKFYVGANDFGKKLHPVNNISVYTKDWKYVGRIPVNIGFETAYGAQTLNAVGDRMLASFYAKGKGTHFLSFPDLKPIEPAPFKASVGFAVIPPELTKGRELYLVAKSTGKLGKNNFGAYLTVYERKSDGNIVPANF